MRGEAAWEMHGEHESRRRRHEEEWDEEGEHEGRRHRHGGPRRVRMGPGPGRRGGRGPGGGPPGARVGGAEVMRGPRVKRGDVRAAALAPLGPGPRNGYQIMQEIGERSGGVWRPSPGSVYPALQQLEDEALIEAETPEGGRRRYALTSEGRAYVEAHPDEVRAPWDVVARSVGDDAIE